MRWLYLILLLPMVSHADLNPAWVGCLNGMTPFTVSHRGPEIDFSGHSYVWDGKAIKEKSIAPWKSDRPVWSLKLYQQSPKHEGRPNIHFPSQELERAMKYLLIESFRELWTIPGETSNWRRLEAAYRSCRNVEIPIRGKGVIGQLSTLRLNELRRKFGANDNPGLTQKADATN